MYQITCIGFLDLQMATKYERNWRGKCRQCGAEFYEKRKLFFHLEKFHRGRLCLFCPSHIFNQTKMYNHISEAHPEVSIYRLGSKWFRRFDDPIKPTQIPSPPESCPAQEEWAKIVNSKKLHAQTLSSFCIHPVTESRPLELDPIVHEEVPKTPEYEPFTDEDAAAMLSYIPPTY